MTQTVLLALYGAIVIGGFFLFFNMAKAATREAKRIGLLAAAGEVYFWMALNQAAQALFVGGICVIRGYDVLVGAAGRSAYPWALIVCFAGLWFTKTGFNYAATVGAKHGKLIWRTLLVVTLAWWIFVLGWGMI